MAGPLAAPLMDAHLKKIHQQKDKIKLEQLQV